MHYKNSAVVKFTISLHDFESERKIFKNNLAKYLKAYLKGLCKDFNKSTKLSKCKRRVLLQQTIYKIQWKPLYVITDNCKFF